MRAFLIALAALLAIHAAHAFTASLSSSAFAARSSLSSQCSAQPAARSGARSMTMKRKGKPNVPIQSRGGYNNMMKAEEAMRAQRNSTPSGVPVFEIYCRTKRANIWYPCGSLGGDERSKATVDALANGFLPDLYRGTIEKGIADSVLGPQKQQLKQTVARMYPNLAKMTNELEFGFKIKYDPLEAKQGKQKITLLNDDMKLGIFDKFKKNLGF